MLLRRSGVLGRVAAWVGDPGGSRVLLVSGWPGAGKSEVAAQVVSMLKDSGSARLGAVSLRPGSKDGTTDALELLGQLGELAWAVDPGRTEAALATVATPTQSTGIASVSDSVVMGDVVGVRLVLHSGADLHQVYRNVVVPALGAGAGGVPVVCVVDGLDEADRPSSIGSFLAQVTSTGEASPPGLLWVVTSRPSDRFDVGKANGSVVELVLDDPRSGFVDDVEAFLEEAFDRLAVDAGDRRRGDAVRVCGGNFLVAHYLVAEMERDPGLDPTVFTVDGDLAGIYQRFLDHLRTRVGDEMLEEYLSVLTAVAAGGPDGADPALVTLVAAVDERRVLEVCDRARDYLTSGEHIAVYHPSFAEFLLSADRDVVQARAAHLGWARAVINDRHVFASLTETQLRQLPWHLVQAVNLARPANRTATETETRQLGWQLFHDLAFVELTELRLGPKALADPATVTLARDLVNSANLPQLVDLDPRTHCDLARVLAVDGNVAQAIRHLEDVLAQENPADPYSPQSHPARTYWMYLRSLPPDVPDSLHLREGYARTAALNGDLETAEAFLERDSAFSAPSALFRSDCLEQLGRTQQAIRILEPFSARNAAVALRLAQLYRRTEPPDIDSAESLLREWAEKNESAANEGAVMALVGLLESQDRPDEAQEVLVAGADKSANVAVALARRLTFAADNDADPTHEEELRVAGLKVLRPWTRVSANAATQSARLLKKLGRDTSELAPLWDATADALWVFQDRDLTARCWLATMLEPVGDPRAIDLLESAARDGNVTARLRIAQRCLAAGNREAAKEWLRGSLRDGRARLRYLMLELQTDPQQAMRQLRGWMRNDPEALVRHLRYPIDDGYDPEGALDVLAFLTFDQGKHAPAQHQTRAMFARLFADRTHHEGDSDDVRRLACDGTLDPYRSGQFLARALWRIDPAGRETLRSQVRPKALTRPTHLHVLWGTKNMLRRRDRLPGRLVQDAERGFRDQIRQLTETEPHDPVSPIEARGLTSDAR